MTQSRFVILIDQPAWRICRVEGASVHCVEVDAPSSIDQASARGVGAALRESGWNGSSVALGLPASWCLAASIETDTGRRRRSADAMAYQLEDKLPIAAESFVADFTPAPGGVNPPTSDSTGPQDSASPGSGTSGGGGRLGVCVELERIRPLVEAMDAEGIAVELIAPTTLLSMQNESAGSDGQHNQADRRVFVVCCVDRRELVVLDGGIPIAWSIHADDASVRRAQAVLGLDTIAQTLNGESVDHAARCAALALDDRVRPWINLRRGALAPGDRWQRLRAPLHAAMTAASILLATASAVWLYQAHQLDRLATNERLAQIEVFKRALPELRVPGVPANPHSRLVSERRRLAGLSATAADTGAGELTATLGSSALYDLVRVLAALPENLRYRVLDLRVEPGRIYIDGQARALSDPDAIAASLSAAGWSIEPPRTQRLKDQGVGFVLTATPGTPGTPTPGNQAAAAPRREAKP